MSDEQLNRDLERMGGSPAMATAMKNALHSISKGSAGSDLAEMARDVLAGRTDLRTVGQTSAYSTHLTDAVGQYQRWQAELTPEEREDLIRSAQRAFDSNPPTD
jgi:hypothetical protein